MLPASLLDGIQAEFFLNRYFGIDKVFVSYMEKAWYLSYCLHFFMVQFFITARNTKEGLYNWYPDLIRQVLAYFTGKTIQVYPLYCRLLDGGQDSLYLFLWDLTVVVRISPIFSSSCARNLSSASATTHSNTPRAILSSISFTFGSFLLSFHTDVITFFLNLSMIQPYTPSLYVHLNSSNRRLDIIIYHKFRSTLSFWG